MCNENGDFFEIVLKRAHISQGHNVEIPQGEYYPCNFAPLGVALNMMYSVH